jgi:hypothetical protein
MPNYYDVLDNGQQPPKRGAKRRAAVSAYLAKQGITPAGAGQPRSAAEKAARAVGREKFAQRKAVRKYVTAKGGKLSPMGERGKREQRLRAEGRAAYAASQRPKSVVKKVKVTSGSRMAPKM